MTVVINERLSIELLRDSIGDFPHKSEWTSSPKTIACSPSHVMIQNLLKYSKFCQKQVSNLIVDWKFHIFVNSEQIYVFLVLI